MILNTLSEAVLPGSKEFTAPTRSGHGPITNDPYGVVQARPRRQEVR